MKRYPVYMTILIFLLFNFYTTIHCEAGAPLPVATPIVTPPEPVSPPVYTPPDPVLAPIYTPPVPLSPPFVTPPVITSPSKPKQPAPTDDDSDFDETVDYCGPKSLPSVSKWIPESPLEVDDKSLFKRACYAHDKCYSNPSCDKTKKECDDNFLNDLIDACINKISNLEQSDQCVKWAGNFLFGVWWGGHIPGTFHWCLDTGNIP
jgi:hypothetical protein